MCVRGVATSLQDHLDDNETCCLQCAVTFVLLPALFYMFTVYCIWLMMVEMSVCSAWDAYLRYIVPILVSPFIRVIKISLKVIAVKYAYLRYVLKCLCCICKYQMVV